MIKVVNENDDRRLILEDAEVEYIIRAGSGQYGRENVVVVFKKGSESYFWNTDTKTKSFADFAEGDKVNIQAIRWGQGRYISNVKRLDKKSEEKPSEEVTEE